MYAQHNFFLFREEFDIIPQESQRNNSPVLHHRNDHKLALESWCVPYLYVHCLQKFKNIRPGGKNVAKTIRGLSEAEKIKNSLPLARLLVLLNPELTMAWNFRRKHANLLCLADVETELNLIRLVGSRKPKMPEGFYYRRYFRFLNCLVSFVVCLCSLSYNITILCK